MSGSGITRRDVLGGAVTVGAASLLTPAGVAAAAGGRTPAFSKWVGALHGTSSAIAAPREFALVGVEWDAAPGPGARIELRSRRSGARWGPWAVASVLGHGPDRPSGPAGRQFGEPIWTGAASFVQLRAARPVRGVRLHFVVAAPAEPPALAGRAAAAFPLAQPVLDAGPGQPPIIARAAWARGQAPPAVAPHYARIRLAFVHHSQTPNGYSASQVPGILLSIFDYHRYVRGYWDIAYNFAIDAFGRVWEARAGGIDEPVLGAHAGGYNAVSTGVVVLGSFMARPPTQAAIDALERLLAWKLSLHGVPSAGRVTVRVDPAGAVYTRFAPGALVSLPRVAGHRDGDTTDCPGNAFYARLPGIRPHVVALAGTVARLTLDPTAPVITAGTRLPLSGTLALLGGAVVAGAPVEIQQVLPGGATTIATATTAADGSWSAQLTPQANTILRALHRPAPAAVSDVAEVAVAPRLTLTVDQPAPLRVSGTIFPARRFVTIRLYKLVGAHRTLIASKRVYSGAGAFHATLRTRGPGRYVVVARARPTARTVAGASPALTLTA